MVFIFSESKIHCNLSSIDLSIMLIHMVALQPFSHSKVHFLLPRPLLKLINSLTVFLHRHFGWERTGPSRLRWQPAVFTCLRPLRSLIVLFHPISVSFCDTTIMCSIVNSLKWLRSEKPPAYITIQIMRSKVKSQDNIHPICIHIYKFIVITLIMLLFLFRICS